MKKSYMVIIFFMLLSFSYAQIHNKTYDFLLVDEIPKFDYNGINFSNYLNTNLRVPKFFSGDDKVIASFIIDKKGRVCDIKIIKYHTKICKDAVIEVLSSMPKWEPGKYKGEFVRVRLYITIDFILK